MSSAQSNEHSQPLPLKALSRILTITAVAGLLVLAFLAGRKFNFLPGLHQEEQADVLLEQVKSACKLITAEGYFSEIYDYKDYYHWDIALLRKKALIRVKARVSLGYDLEQMQIEALPDQRKLVISSLPGVEILSIEHELDYYDISEGTFNSFTADDYNELQSNARDYIKKVALSSELVAAAEAQGNEMLVLIRSITESAGWTLEVIEPERPPFSG